MQRAKARESFRWLTTKVKGKSRRGDINGITKITGCLGRMLCLHQPWAIWVVTNSLRINIVPLVTVKCWTAAALRTGVMTLMITIVLPQVEGVEKAGIGQSEIKECSTILALLSHLHLSWMILGARVKVTTTRRQMNQRRRRAAAFSVCSAQEAPWSPLHHLINAHLVKSGQRPGLKTWTSPAIDRLSGPRGLVPLVEVAMAALQISQIRLQLMRCNVSS